VLRTPTALRRPAAIALFAIVALVFGFLVAVQIRAQLLTPSNQVARTAALVRSAQDLEHTNKLYRDRIAELRAQITALEAEAAQRSSSDLALEQQLAALRELAGLTPLRGPGVTVTLADGQPGGPQLADHLGYRITFEDIQDVVNLLFAGGAEGVTVNGRRITPLSGFQSDGVDVLIDQGPPLDSPFTIRAVGDRPGMERLLQDPNLLPDVRLRVERFQVGFTWTGASDLLLPAYDSSLAVDFAHAP
jgi:uncharacterized protein YlxW (UPF0749 family)